MVPIEQKDWTKKTEPRYWAKITHSIPRRSLYKSLGGYHCRRCFDDPRYATQNKSTKNRIAFAASKLRLGLNGMASLSEARPERPKGMHRRTYERLLRRLEVLESRLSLRQKAKPVDYRNLVHYLKPSFLK
jgi:hypothetical protein